MSKRFMPTSPRCSMQALLIALKGRHCLSVRGGQGRVLAASCLKADAMPTQAVKKSIKTKSAPTTWRSNFEPRKKWSRICMPGLNMRQTTQPELPEPWTILRGANAAAFKPAHHSYAEFVCRICMPHLYAEFWLHLVPAVRGLRASPVQRLKEPRNPSLREKGRHRMPGLILMRCL